MSNAEPEASEMGAPADGALPQWGSTRPRVGQLFDVNAEVAQAEAARWDSLNFPKLTTFEVDGKQGDRCGAWRPHAAVDAQSAVHVESPSSR